MAAHIGTATARRAAANALLILVAVLAVLLAVLFPVLLPVLFPAAGPAAAAPAAVPAGAPAGVPTELRAAVPSPHPWVWPLSPAPAVLRAYQPPAQRWAPGHRGVDLAAVPGQQVLAPAAGTVSFAGVVVDRGVLTITHPGGLRTSLEPVTPVVAVGDVVARGQPVARVSAESSHCALRTCLHWGVRRGEAYLDPLRLLFRPPPSVLLPLNAHGALPPDRHGSTAWSPR